MSEVSIWNVTGSPTRYKRGEIDLEKQLAAWIEADPSLIAPGLQIVARQLQLESGSMDLLGIDPLGRWTAITIKRGNLRRETFTQAIDAAACIGIEEMPPRTLAEMVEHYLAERGTTLDDFLSQMQLDDNIFDERNMTIYIVATGREQKLDSMTKFLRGSGLHINVIHFDVFESNAGERLLLRKLTAINTEHEQTTKKPPLRVHNPQIDRLIALADQNGNGDTFRLLHEAALKHGMYPRTYKWSIMYTPPDNRTRVLLCSWSIRRQGELELYISTRQFAEFYPISEREAVKMLGENRYERFTSTTLPSFMKKLDKLFAQIVKNS